jgi:hypothetical protein
MNTDTTAHHLAVQAEMMRKLEADTAWILSEQAGYDVRATPAGRKLLNLELARIITDGFGAWAAAQADKTEDIQ